MSESGGQCGSPCREGERERETVLHIVFKKELLVSLEVT